MIRCFVLALLLAGCAPSAALKPPQTVAAETRQATPQALAEPAVRADTAAARGRELAVLNCSTCHAVGPIGDSPYAPAPPFRTLSKRVDIDSLGEAFAEGIQVGHRGVRQMPMWELKPGQIDDLTAYLKSL